MTRHGATGAWVAVMMTLVGVSAAPDVDASTGSVPWAVGDTVDAGWQVSRIQRHPEFVRLRLTKAEATAEIEVAPGQPGTPWSTTHYRVQPQPGAPAAPEALKATLSALARWEKTADHVPFVATVVRTPPETAPPQATSQPRAERPTLRLQHATSWPPEARWSWLVCGALLLALLALCLARSRVGLLGLLGSVVAGVLTWVLIDPSSIPVRWLTVLQEGSVASVVASIHGQGHHGPAIDALRWLLGQGDVVALREVVLMNLALTVGNTLAVGSLTYALTRRPDLALLTAAAWALSPLQVNAAFSDLPTGLLTSCVLAGVVAVGVLPRAPWLGLFTLGVAAVFASGVRAEWGVLGMVAWLSALVSERLSNAMRTRLNRGWTTAAMIGSGAGVIGVLGTLGAGTAASAPEAWTLWQAQGGGAVGAGMLTWPLALLGGWPIGLVVLATIGLIATLRRPVRWTAGPTAMVLLYGVYWTSSHHGDAPYELLRYAALMSGLAIGLAALGWRIVLRWTARLRRGRLVWMGLAVVCVIPAPDAAWRPMLEAHHAESSGPLYDMPLTRHVQAEARSLIGAMEARPDCIIASVSAVEPSANREVNHYEYIFFGGSLMAPQIAPRDPQQFEALRETVAPGKECVLFHRGIDCHVAGGPTCEAETQGGRFVSGFLRPDRPYYDHVMRRSPMTLELWER